MGLILEAASYTEMLSRFEMLLKMLNIAALIESYCIFLVSKDLQFQMPGFLLAIFVLVSCMSVSSSTLDGSRGP